MKLPIFLCRSFLSSFLDSVLLVSCHQTSISVHLFVLSLHAIAKNQDDVVLTFPRLKKKDMIDVAIQQTDWKLWYFHWSFFFFISLVMRLLKLDSWRGRLFFLFLVLFFIGLDTDRPNCYSTCNKCIYDITQYFVLIQTQFCFFMIELLDSPGLSWNWVLTVRSLLDKSNLFGRKR